MKTPSEAQRLTSMIAALDQDLRPSALRQLSKQQSHSQCMLCGNQAILGLRLNFYADGDRQVWSMARGTVHNQGYQGILHGGFLAALLDAGMCHAVFNQNIQAVTADMSIRYLKEVPVNSEILISAKLVGGRSPLYNVEAELYVAGERMVKSQARFMKKSPGAKQVN